MERVVIHIDLDCFYAQVESKRLGIPQESVPLAVQQWQGLIAVNYAARKQGVTR
jgi:DNA polymerase eta